MNLNYEMPAWAEEKLPPVSEEKRYYSVPYDIGADGVWLSDSYLVVTQKKIYLLSEGSPHNVLRWLTVKKRRQRRTSAVDFSQSGTVGKSGFWYNIPENIWQDMLISPEESVSCVPEGRKRWKVRSMRKSVRTVDERSRGQNIVRIVRKKEAFGIPF